MTIQKEFILRYRSNGHVRFQVPAKICSEAVAYEMERSLSEIDGVVSVHLFSKQRKLSIRFTEVVCSFTQLANQLSSLINQLERTGVLVPRELAIPQNPENWRQKVGAKISQSKASQWFKGKYSDAKETVQAAKILTKIGMNRPKSFLRDPEKAIIDFLNDILVLYLIKIHWKRITQVWILSPFKYRYEWLAVFYLFFLLMRSKRPKL